MKTLEKIQFIFNRLKLFQEEDLFRLWTFMILSFCILFSSYFVMNYHLDNYLCDNSFVLLDWRLFLYLLILVCISIIYRMIVRIGNAFIVSVIYVLIFGIFCRAYAARTYFSIIEREGHVEVTNGTVDNVFYSSGRGGKECSYWYKSKNGTVYRGSFKISIEDKTKVGDNVRIVYSTCHPRISRVR